MEHKELDYLVQQVRCILLNKQRPSELQVHDPELVEIQEALDYLASCLQESNEFLDHLQRGILDVEAPGRDNFLAWRLKELHSALRYLTWQANQVANGDYNQSVHFLGDFSKSFNRMVGQLAEREAQLKTKTFELEQTAGMMKSIMDSFHEWILVCEKESGRIIYINQPAKEFFLDGEGGRDAKDLLTCLAEYQCGEEGDHVWEFQDTRSKKTFRIKSYELPWDGIRAYSHLISDITAEKERQERMRGLAYLDELTGLHNRRFCMDALHRILVEKVEFSYCMIDLDGLKYANDHFGHESGDEYLKTVARELCSLIRTTDVACRIGGDEFALLLPNCSLDTAQNKMEQLNQALKARSGRFPMSISFGVSHAAQGEVISAQEILEQADGKMYVFKNVKKAAQEHGNETIVNFAWSSELATGDERIDQEHKQLIDRCNQLSQACAMGRGTEELRSAVAFLLEYTNMHFAKEEEMQLQAHYPGYAYHKRAHMMFVQRLENLASRLEQEGPTVQLTAEVNQRLCVWLMNHIKVEDANAAVHIMRQAQQNESKENTEQ